MDANALWSDDADDETFVCAATVVVQPSFVPELTLRVAHALAPVWEALERRARRSVPPPYWAFPWPGSLAFARYVLDHPELVARRRVLDFAAGSGLAGIAAAQAGAAFVRACDIDPVAAIAQRLNAALNDVSLETTTEDLIGRDLDDIDVVLAGDICYERETSRRIVGWLRHLADQGLVVLLADPGRAYTPSKGLKRLATYDVPTTRELENSGQMQTTIWRVLSPHGARS